MPGKGETTTDAWNEFTLGAQYGASIAFDRYFEGIGRAAASNYQATLSGLNIDLAQRDYATTEEAFNFQNAALGYETARAIGASRAAAGASGFSVGSSSANEMAILASAQQQRAILSRNKSLADFRNDVRIAQLEMQRDMQEASARAERRGAWWEAFRGTTAGFIETYRQQEIAKKA